VTYAERRIGIKGEGRRCPQFLDFAGDLFIRARLFQALQPGRLAFVEPAVKGFPPRRWPVSASLLCYLARSSLLKSVLRRIRLKPVLAFDGAIGLFRRDHPLLRKTVRDYGRHRAMEELQDPVVNALQAGAQFADAVSQGVRFGPTQFVAHLALDGYSSEETEPFYKGIPRVELTGLSPEKTAALLKQLNRQRCTCDCVRTIASCRNNHSSCSLSLAAARGTVEAAKKH
jgi:hypothetical protein